jgi:hypothetical protein
VKQEKLRITNTQKALRRTLTSAMSSFTRSKDGKWSFAKCRWDCY